MSEKTGLQKIKERFGHYTSYVIAVFVAILVWAVLSARSEAAEIRIGLGGGVTNENGWIVQELYARQGHWWGAALRTGDDNVLPDTWRFSAGWRHDWREGARIRPGVSFGAAYWQDDITPLISDSLSYHMALSLRFWDVIDLEFQHNSTAGRSEFNDGNDLLVLAVVFPIGE